MSQDNENKPEDLSFDVNDPDQTTGAGNPFAENDDFNPFAEDAFTFQDSAPENDAVPGSGSESADIELDEFSNESVVEPENNLEFPTNADVAPSGFLSGLNEPSENSELAGLEFPAAPAVDATPAVDGKKKGKEKKVKPEKKKKEKKVKAKDDSPKEPMGIGALLALILAVFLLIALIAANALIFLYPPYAKLGVGFSSTIYFAVGLNVFGLLMILVPGLFYLRSKDVDFFQAGLGVSVMLLAFGMVGLLSALYRYDFSTKAPAVTPYSPPASAAAPAE